MWGEQLSNDTKDFWVDYEIRKISNCVPLEFCKQVYSRYHPIILTEMISHWSALEKWKDEDYFHQKLQDKRISVNLTPNGQADSVQRVEYEGKFDNYFIYPAEVQMTIKEFFHLLHQENHHPIVPYLSQQNDNLRLEFPELLEDIDQNFPLAIVFDNPKPEAVNLWIGDERSVSSIHKDHFENFYFVIYGEKTFTLFPPTDIAFLPERSFPTIKYQPNFDGEGNVADLRLTKDGLPCERLSWIPIDPDHLDKSESLEWNDKRLCTPIHCTVRAGEVLYIPAMWYHRVSQTELTVSVNMWYDQRFDFRFVLYNLVKQTKENSE